MATKPKFNPVATALLEPFDESEIKKREGAGGKEFSYVPPENYRRRLLEVFEEGFEFSFTEVVEGKEGVRANARFKGTVSNSGIAYIIGPLPVYEEWTVGRDFLWNDETKKYDKPNPKAGKVLERGNTYAMLVSAGLKACSREMGLGLHLYDKGPDNNKSNKSSTKSSSGNSGGGSSNDSGDWDGSEEIKFGKNKGSTWADVDEGYLTWVRDKMDDPAKGKAIKELARRQGNAGAEGTANAKKAMDAKASEPEDDDDIPF